jgi:hypothetical protein
MEYLAGSIFTLIAVYLVLNLVIKNRNKFRPVTVRHRQSIIFSTTFPLGPYRAMQGPGELKTQATDFFDRNNFKTVMYEENAYWIEKEIFFTAPIVDGKIDQNNKKRVDTMGMSSVELNELMLIVEKLREGSRYDGGSSRN